MSQKIFSMALLAMLILTFLLLGERILMYLRISYPDLSGGIVAALTGLICIALSLFSAYLLTLLHYWLTK